MRAARRINRFVLAAIALLGFAVGSPAHEVRPALLEITERADGRHDISWKRPIQGEMAVRLVPHIEGGLIDEAPHAVDTTGTFQLLLWQSLDSGSSGLEGRKVWVEGLDQTITDVLVSIRQADGATQESLLTPDTPTMILSLRKPALAAPAYLMLGIEHILTGYDHLAFVLGLLLLVASRMMLITTVTAFTLAHSITLGLTALGIVTVRPALIEALVALSIMFVAVELLYVYRGKSPLMARYPWAIALAFGLLHGCAFAGALAEIGLPKDAVLPALLLFNFGVEIGQLLFVAAVLVVGLALARLPMQSPRVARWFPPYAIGSVAAFWFVERVATIGGAP